MGIIGVIQKVQHRFKQRFKQLILKKNNKSLYAFTGVESGQKRAEPCFDGRVVYLLIPLQERLYIAHAFSNHFRCIFG